MLKSPFLAHKKKIKIPLLFYLTLALLTLSAGLMPSQASADATYTIENPYNIASSEDLKAFKEYVED